MIISVALQNTTNNSIPTESQFQLWVDTALAVSANSAPTACNEIAITIVDKEQSAELNTQYREKSGPTNVLAFTYDPMPGFAQESLGDLVICADIVTAEATIQSTPLDAHWAHLTIHGTLHLLGYDHIDLSDAEIMEPLEIKALATLGFSNPYPDDHNTHV